MILGFLFGTGYEGTSHHVLDREQRGIAGRIARVRCYIYIYMCKDLVRDSKDSFSRLEIEVFLSAQESGRGDSRTLQREQAFTIRGTGPRDR